MPPKYSPTVARVDQELSQAAKGVEVILLDDLNVRLREPCNTWEEELATVVTECGLEYMTSHFMPRKRYIGDGRWTWQMRREDRQVTEQGDYVLGTSRHTFFNAGVREARIHTEQRMVLAVCQGEGEHWNGTY